MNALGHHREQASSISKGTKPPSGPTITTADPSGTDANACGGPLIADPTGPASAERSELIFHKGAKALMQVNLRSDRVARALHAGLQRFSHLGRLQQRRLPKTFFHPRTVD